jgi:GNAT superfamily N-acetyltransferase
VSSAAFALRAAVAADTLALRDLIERSVRQLQANDYSFEQREAALRTVFGVDSQLIADGTYFAVEPKEQPGVIVGCGGWSKRRTLYGGDHWHGRQDSLLDPNVDAAKIRAFFVSPEWARRGIGTLILRACENAAMEAGFRRFEMGATLTGVHLYAVHGYVEREWVDAPLGDGLTLPVVRMEKVLS